MKRICVLILCLCMFLTAVTACGQRPEVPDSSVPVDVSASTTTTTTAAAADGEDSTTADTSTTEELTTTTTAKPTTTVRESTTTTAESTTAKRTTTTTRTTTTETITTTTAKPTTIKKKTTTTNETTTTATESIPTLKTTSAPTHTRDTDSYTLLNDDRIFCYGITRDSFYLFMQSPSSEFLATAANYVVRYSASPGTKSTGTTGRTKSTGTTGTIVEDQTLGSVAYEYVDTGHHGVRPSGQAREGNLIIYRSLISLIDQPVYLREKMNCLAADETILETALVYCSGYPYTIFVKTDKNNYFLTIDDVVLGHESSEDKPEGTYTVSVYTQEEFCNMFLPRSATLVVKGQIIPCGDLVKLHYNYADLPLVIVLKAIGAEIIWQDEIVAQVVIGEHKLMLDLSGNCSLSGPAKPSEHGNEVLPPDYISSKPVWPRFCQATTKEVVLDSNTISHVLYVTDQNLTLDIDYDQQVITIQ